ncbi:MAG: murein L,D-transpeptidase catalytic domain family protein [Pseudomonadota bacterium]|nr:murein L,D-transpeptidase catalytic domain family protein [Pseudomonadota bacterium]
MNRLLIVPGVALLAGGLYLFISDTDESVDEKPVVSISLGEPTPIGSSEIGTTTVTDAVEFKVLPVTLDPVDEPADVVSQAEVTASQEEISPEAELPVEAESFETSEMLASSDEGDSQNAPEVADVEAENIESDKQSQISSLVKHEITIDSSLYHATNEAGLSANQTARIGKIIEPYLDASRELRQGDKLIVTLDPAAGDAPNDADQVHGIEYQGAKKAFVITRVAGSLSDYEAARGDGVMRDEETSSSPVAVAELQQQKEESVEAAVTTAQDNQSATAGMKRVEGVISVSFFSAAREAGLNAGQIETIRKILTPYINFNREMRKGDRFVVMLDGEDVYSCEYIGAVKQLLATRDDQGAFKVTDKAGADITVAESAGISPPKQSTENVLAEKTLVNSQAKSQAKVDTRKQISSGNKTLEERVFTTDIVHVEKSKPQVTSRIEQPKANDSAVKVVGINKSNSLQVGKVTPKRSEKESSRQTRTKKSFWKNLGFGSSKVAGGNWKPKNRQLAKVFDKVAASGKVEKKALRRAFKYYQDNRKSSGLAQTHIAIADYTKLATTRRLHIINLKTAGVTSVQVAHGRKSGPIGGRVTSTSNANGSNQTTKGFYRVGTKEGRTSSKNLPYLSVQGLESGNRLVGLPPRKGGRDIIIHTAGYVASGGRSLGCFSIRPQDKRLVFNKLKGVLFYSYVG